MDAITVREVLGTKVTLVKQNSGNPARNTEDCHLFHAGYWEVHISSSGEHPDFIKGQWKILFVRLTRPTVEFEIKDGQGLFFVPVGARMQLENIETRIERHQIDGVWWQFPGLIITLSNQYECRIQCDEPVMLHSVAHQ